MKIAIEAMMNGIASAVGRSPSFTTRRPRIPSRKSCPLVGLRYSRMPRTARGRKIEHMQITAMPMARSRPKSRIIGTFANCSARKAKIASNVTTSSAGPRFREVSWIGWGLRSMTTSSSTLAWSWIA